VKRSEPWVRQAERDEWPHGKGDSATDQQAARQPAKREAGDELTWRERGQQDVGNVALDLGNQQRRRGVGESVLRHSHQDQARREEL